MPARILRNPIDSLPRTTATIIMATVARTDRGEGLSPDRSPTGYVGGVRTALALVALSGCNQIYGLEPTTGKQSIDADMRPDRDHDGLADAIDPCIAGASDYATDNDGVPPVDGEDPCPLDFGETDTDADGIPDACDPFPALPGDRYRCSMSFANPDLNMELWRLREGEPWTLTDRLRSPEVTAVPSTLVVDESIEAPGTTTYTFRTLATPTIPTPPDPSIRLIVRAGADPTRDIGCELADSVMGKTISVFGPGVRVTRSGATGFRSIQLLVATFEPAAPAGRPNLRCSAQVSSQVVGGTEVLPTVVGSVPVGPGRFGISIYAGTGIDSGWSFLGYPLVIHDRDDAPPL